MQLTQEQLKQILYYREDGALCWVSNFTSRARKDAPAGSLNNSGYLRVGVNGEDYLNHRLVWLWHHGYLPEHGLDHRDRDKLNNRIGNLREVGQVCNIRNTGNRITNTSGVKGVCWHKAAQKWHATITVGGRTVNLGCYVDFTEAVCHRLAAEQDLDWSGCDTSSPAFQFVSLYAKGRKI